MSGSRVIHAAEAGWAGVEPRTYKEGTGNFQGVIRHTLLGGRDAGPELNFEVRYFEVAPGGYSSLERHEHPHAVMVVRGRGSVRLGDRVEPVAPLDVVYVGPQEVHRFDADRGESLGFVCIVDRDRDRPVPVSDDEPAGP